MDWNLRKSFSKIITPLAEPLSNILKLPPFWIFRGCNTGMWVDLQGNLSKLITPPSKYINVESTLNQRWSIIFINVVSTLIFWLMFGYFPSSVYLSTLFQRWQNNVDKITSIQRRWTNVALTLKFGWKWKLSWRMFIDVVSTLIKQHWNNVEKNYVDSMLMTQCCFSVHIWLKTKVESTYVHRRWESSIETTLSTFVVLMFTRKWLNNKTKFSSIHHIFLLYKNIIKVLFQL